MCVTSLVQCSLQINCINLCRYLSKLGALESRFLGHSVARQTQKTLLDRSGFSAHISPRDRKSPRMHYNLLDIGFNVLHSQKAYWFRTLVPGTCAEYMSFVFVL